MSAQPSILQAEGLSKTFGGTRALIDVSLDVSAGEVHALVGQNGSGKSTLIKVLSGYHRPDRGSIAIRGASVRLPLAPSELRHLGVAFVHQDLGLVETMSVVENIGVGRYETGFGRRILWRRERDRTRRLLKRFNLDLDPDTPIGKLSQTERVIVAVMRALPDVQSRTDSGLLVLDEPTSALPAGEVDLLFEAMRTTVASGAAVLFVTHDVEDVFRISDRVTILRDGRKVSTVDTNELSPQRLVELIVGRKLGELYPSSKGAAEGALLEVADLSGDVAKNISFNLGRREILGVTGLVGAGHDELPYLVYGARPPRRARITLDGQLLGQPTPDRCMEAGIVLVPNDRLRLSTVPAATVKENVTLPTLRTFRKRVGIDHSRERTAVEDVLAQFSVRPPDPDRLLYTLSGGNQQKAVLGRWLRMKPRVMLLHEPTQGIDIGARGAIFRILRDCVSDGTSIVYASAEYEDLAHICDRVLVVRHGRVVSELRGEELHRDTIAAHCYGGSGRALAS